MAKLNSVVTPEKQRLQTLSVTVKADACRSVAALLSNRAIPVDREDAKLHGFTRHDVGNFYLWLVAICHQTSPKGKPPLEGMVNGRSVRGWDYLSYRFQTAAKADTALLSPVTWSEMVGGDLVRLFHDADFGDRLTNPEARAELVRDLGRRMIENNWQKLDDLYAIAEGRIATGAPNLLDLLSTFRAYDDPVRKKSYFLLALMRNTGLWQYPDNELLGPPVDYHEVRGHLRLGTVAINDPSLHAKLLNGEPVGPDEDIAIRAAVHDAIMLISSLSGVHNPSQLHYLFWNVFRACCTRESPHCYQCPSDCALPTRYVQLGIDITGTRRCMFSSVCQSAGRDPKFIEHNFSTDYY